MEKYDVIIIGAGAAGLMCGIEAGKRRGVDCNAISSKTMAANTIAGLFFIGEVLDVTGWLGDYNFQWAWPSGWVAGQVV